MNTGNGLEYEKLRRLFDANWYLKQFPESAAVGGDPLLHYIERGAAAGYDPHPMFRTSWYLVRYPDVAASGMNPLVHYIIHGLVEGRDPHPLFDTSWYLRRYPDTAANGVSPLIDYLERGIAEGRQPGPLFSESVNFTIDQDVAAKMRAQYDWEIGRLEVTRQPNWLARPRAALIKCGSFCYKRSLFFFASVFYRAAHRLSPTRQDELLTLLAKCDIRRGNFDLAFDWFASLCNLAPPPDLHTRTAAMPFVSHGSGKKFKTIGVVTSVMPKRIEAQQAALQSWRAAGLSVVSVNSVAEADGLRKYFPDITFRIVNKPAEDSLGRPLIPIQELVRAARETSNDICGIINSDIQFCGEGAFFDSVREHVPGSLVFGCRVDFADTGFTNGKTFRNGYDFFFWDKENSALFEETPMILGMPWWDFWLPLHAHAQGLKVKHLVTSSMVHVTHPIGYNIPAYVHFGQCCAQTLAGVYGRSSGEHQLRDRAFLHRLFATAATIPVTSDADAESGLRRIGIFCELANCIIDVVSEKLVLRDARKASGALDPL